MIIAVPYVRKLIKELVAFMDPLIESAEYLEPVQVIQSIRTTFDYDRFIVDEDIPSPDDVKINNINQLQLAAARYSTIGAFLDYADSFQDETVGDDKEGVSLSTIHKSKGAEYPVVFVIGMIEGLLPSGNHPDKMQAKVIDDKVIAKERKKEFEISRINRFRYRTRYFTDSGIIGTKEFVSATYGRFKHLFMSKKDKVPKPVKGLDGVFSLKRLAEI